MKEDGNIERYTAVRVRFFTRFTRGIAAAHVTNRGRRVVGTVGYNEFVATGRRLDYLPVD
jgi:hypothetical protein